MVDQVKRGIIRIYLDDFQKLDPTGRLETLFTNIPAQLSQQSNRYKPYSVLGDIDSNKLIELLKDLEDSKTTLIIREAERTSFWMKYIAIQNGRMFNKTFMMPFPRHTWSLQESVC